MSASQHSSARGRQHVRALRCAGACLFAGLVFAGCGPVEDEGGEGGEGGACGASTPYEQVCGTRGRPDDACVGRKELDFGQAFGPQTFIPDAPGAYAYAVSFDTFDGLAFWEIEQGPFEIARGDASNTWEGVSGPADPGTEFTMRISRGGAGSEVTSARLSITQVSYGSASTPWPVEPGAEHCHSVGHYGKANYRGSSQSIYVFTAPEAGAYTAAIYDFPSATPMELEWREVSAGQSYADALAGAPSQRVGSSDNQAEVTMELAQGEQALLVVSNKGPEVGGQDKIGFDPYSLTVKPAR